MKCERCGGLTINAYFSGGLTAIDAWEYDGRKCLNCGSITDPLILRNKVALYQRWDRRQDSGVASEREAGDLASPQFSGAAEALP